MNRVFIFSKYLLNSLKTKDVEKTMLYPNVNFNYKSIVFPFESSHEYCCFTNLT